MLNDRGDGYPVISTVSGQSLDTNTVVVKYALIGDLDFSGKLDADDYFVIDRGFRWNQSGYQHGDLDYNNTIDGDDFGLVDRAFASLFAVD